MCEGRVPYAFRDGRGPHTFAVALTSPSDLWPDVVYLSHVPGVPMNLALLSGAVVLLNLPFGYWRSRSRKLSVQWFLAVHLPVPLIIALRLSTGVGWHAITFPLFIGSFFAGQFLGGKLGRL
jgi:hypothetical protein